MAKSKLSKAEQLALKQQQDLLNKSLNSYGKDISTKDFIKSNIGTSNFKQSAIEQQLANARNSKVFTPPNAAGLIEGIPNPIPEVIPTKPPVWESPILNGVSQNSIDPRQVQRGWNEFQTSKLPDIQGIESRIGNYKTPSVEGIGSKILNNPITKAISNELEYAKPFAKAGGTALGVIGAGNLAYGAYQANKDELQTDQNQATKLGDSIKGYQLDKTQPATNVGDLGNPLDNLDYAYRANKVNNDLIQQTSVLPTKQPTPIEASNGFTPIGGVNTGNILDNPNISKPQSDLNYKLTSDKVNPYDKALSTEQTLGQVQQPQQQQAKVTNGVTVNQDANGNPVISNTNKSFSGMFTGMNKERDASLDSYGKVRKDSDFYKRNKQAMSNLSMTGF